MSQASGKSFFGVNFEQDVVSCALDAFSSMAISNESEASRSLVPRWQRSQSKQEQSTEGDENAKRYFESQELMIGRNEKKEEEENQGHEQSTKEDVEMRCKSRDSIEAKILTYQDKAPQPSEGYASNLRVLYTGNAANTKDASSANRLNKTRVISQSAERVLDAPELGDCFYSNLLDWGVCNVVAVGLGSCVYLWNSQTGQIDLLKDKDDHSVCSVKWTHTGTHIAVGMSDATVALWDVKNKKILRKIRGHSARVGSLAWNNSMISTGSSDATIMNHDVRTKESLLSTIKTHEQAICGLQWDNNSNGSYLASGGNDNIVCIWELNQMSNTECTPKHIFRESRAAVKALAWCPWQKNLLATGGGTGDMHIRFYDVVSGNCFNEVDTQSQVCSLIWNPFDKEILSSHGFNKYQLSIWKYPSLIKTHDLTGHTARVLHTALSPDGSMVCSGAADETLRFWKVFEKLKPLQKGTQDVTKIQSASLNMRIR